MIPVVGICGASNSGKTTLVEKLLPELNRRGLKVGVLKHHGHGGPVATPAEWQGKDSDRLIKAGARRVALSHSGGVWLEAPGLAGAGPGPWPPGSWRAWTWPSPRASRPRPSPR